MVINYIRRLLPILFPVTEAVVCTPQGQAPDTEIGRVFINDFDDWDLPDKNFYWEGAEHPKFRLNEDTGMITMRHGTWNGR